MANSNKKSPPARTAKAKENQLISLAVELAEKKLRDGTASSQIIVTLLNLATQKYKLEMTKLKSDIDLSQAKRKNLDQADSRSELYENALNAFKKYQGNNFSEEDDDYED